MGCGCANQFCEPAEPRCECQQNCWMGPPDEYEDCIAACPDDCGFPKYPGLPSKGYRCADHPTANHSTCTDDCSSVWDSALASCDTDKDACLATASPEEEEACLSAACTCQGDANRDKFACEKECDRSYAFSEALGCAASEVSVDASCCNVELSTCLEPCESAYLSAMASYESAWLDCIETHSGIGGQWIPTTEAEPGHCIQSSNPDYFYCNAARDLNSSEVMATLRVCRATCEAEEMRRHEPDQRKLRECGAEQHICDAECGGDQEYEANLCALNYFVTTHDCTTDDCWLTAGEDYRACMYDVIVAQVGCRKDCCKEQNPNARNGHGRPDYVYDCWKARLDSDIACANTFDECMSDCTDGDASCAATCDSAYCACESTAKSTYDICSAGAPRGDCPDCFDRTIRDTTPPGERHAEYSTGAGGLPSLPSESDCA